MKQAMKEMLQEFIERDFTAREMCAILEAIEDVEQGYRLLKIYRKRDELEMAIRVKGDIHLDTLDLDTLLQSYSLDYSVDDLVDDGGVEL